MTDTMTFHKLIVLYMLSRVDFPLTRNQIGDFLTERPPNPPATERSFPSRRRGGRLFPFLAISCTIPSGRTLTNTFGRIISGCATRFPSGPITRRPPPASTALIWWQRTEETP